MSSRVYCQRCRVECATRSCVTCERTNSHPFYCKLETARAFSKEELGLLVEFRGKLITVENTKTLAIREPIGDGGARVLQVSWSHVLLLWNETGRVTCELNPVLDSSSLHDPCSEATFRTTDVDEDVFVCIAFPDGRVETLETRSWDEVVARVGLVYLLQLGPDPAPWDLCCDTMAFEALRTRVSSLSLYARRDEDVLHCLGDLRPSLAHTLGLPERIVFHEDWEELSSFEQTRKITLYQQRSVLHLLGLEDDPQPRFLDSHDSRAVRRTATLERETQRAKRKERVELNMALAQERKQSRTLRGAARVANARIAGRPMEEEERDDAESGEDGSDDDWSVCDDLSDGEESPLMRSASPQRTALDRLVSRMESNESLASRTSSKKSRSKLRPPTLPPLGDEACSSGRTLPKFKLGVPKARTVILPQQSVSRASSLPKTFKALSVQTQHALESLPWYDPDMREPEKIVTQTLEFPEAVRRALGPHVTRLIRADQVDSLTQGNVYKHVSHAGGGGKSGMRTFRGYAVQCNIGGVLTRMAYVYWAEVGAIIAAAHGCDARIFNQRSAHMWAKWVLDPVNAASWVASLPETIDVLPDASRGGIGRLGNGKHAGKRARAHKALLRSGYSHPRQTMPASRPSSPPPSRSALEVHTPSEEDLERLHKELPDDLSDHDFLKLYFAEADPFSLGNS